MSVEFELHGLNPRQMFLADIIWACQTRPEINKFIQGLPTQVLRNEARSIVDLMIMAVVEQCYDGVSPNMDEAGSVISKVRKG